jgi:hypothetical protein
VGIDFKTIGRPDGYFTAPDAGISAALDLAARVARA